MKQKATFLVTALLGMSALIAACGPSGDAVSNRAADAPRPNYPEFIDANGVRLPGALLARGDSVFHGRGVGSICSACHGREGIGSPMVRPLADNVWGYTDGSLAGIREITRTGVEDAPTPMPPMGGASLSPADLEAVSAYVYWISRREGHDLRRADATGP
jgi:mono/diheme cytochrome c family protein